MNKADAVGAIAGKIGITKKAAGQAYDLLFQEMATAIQKGQRVQVPNFGSFSLTKRKARTVRNPSTGATIQIDACKNVRFKPGKKLKEALNGR